MQATPALLPRSATPKSHEDFAVALRVAELLGDHPLVESISIGGSIARGIGDEFSDLDLLVYCSAFPLDGEIGERLQSLRPLRWKSHPAFRDQGLIVEAFVSGGTEVDLNVLLVSTVEDCLQAVLERHQLSTRLQSFVGGFVDATSLYGHALHHDWQRRARDYPPALGRKMVERHLRIEPFWVPGIGSCREGDLLVLYDAVSRVQRGLLGLLLGLNRQYKPRDYKRVRRLVGSFGIAPPDLGRRLEACFEIPPDQVDPHLRALVHDVFDLVEAHLPELDVESARRDFTANPALAPVARGHSS